MMYLVNSEIIADSLDSLEVEILILKYSYL